MYCGHCGTENSDTSKFCKKCGQPLQVAVEKDTNVVDDYYEDDYVEKKHKSSNTGLKIVFGILLAIVLVGALAVGGIMLGIIPNPLQSAPESTVVEQEVNEEDVKEDAEEVAGNQEEEEGLLLGGITSEADDYPETDIFDKLEVVFSGTEPNITAGLSYKGLEFTGTDFSIDKASGLKNGDKITVSLTDAAQAHCKDVLKKKPKEVSRVYEVKGIDTAPSSPEVSGEYIFPNSDTQLLTEDDVKNLTKEQSRIAINEIYARYGRKFTDDALQAHFNSCSWYKGIYEPKEFNTIFENNGDGALNEIELKNKNLLVEYAIKMGYREK